MQNNLAKAVKKRMKTFKPGLKFLVYASVTLILSGVSFLIRDFLHANYDQQNFFLFSIDFVKNTGAAFSLFQTHTDVLIVVSVLILAAVVLYVLKHIKSLAMPSIILLSLFSAGILGNLAERMADGFVTDYIRITFVDFPIFNLSDIFINIAAFLIICKILFGNEKRNA